MHSDNNKYMMNYNKGTVKQKRYTDIYNFKTPAVKVVQRPKCPLKFRLMKADPHTYIILHLFGAWLLLLSNEIKSSVVLMQGDKEM